MAEQNKAAQMVSWQQEEGIMQVICRVEAGKK